MQSYYTSRTLSAIITSLAITFLSASAAFGQPATLTLSSTGTLANVANFNLSLNVGTGVGPAELQWAFSYPPGSVASIAATPGAALVAAAKTLDCNAGANAYTCVAYGLNATSVGNGIVANVSVSLASGVTGLSMGVGGAVAASAVGEPVSLSGTGASTTTALPLVTGLTCGSSSLGAGATTTCTVSVNTQPSANATVALTSSSAFLTGPSSVVLPAGATSATFTVVSGNITTDQNAILTASLNGSTQTATLTLSAPMLISSFQCSPSVLSANMNASCQVGLSKATPSGALLSLSSNSPAIVVPNSLTVAGGASSASFGITTAVSLPQTSVVNLTATLGTQSVTASITMTGSASVVSLWSASAVPSQPWVPTAGPLTAGVRFYSDVNGTVNGVRFYKGVGNGTSGHHVGLLYSSTGTLLAQGTFSNESASGWQQVNFSTPVAISANTTYIVALYTNSGCADDGQYFAHKGVDNGPLHAPKSTGSQGNGVYVYANAPAFPSLSYSASNYWVDLAFSPGSTAPVTPPVTTAPANSTSLWSASAVPSLPWVATAGPLTVGLRFYSDVNGTVNGVRFYKGVGSGMSGHHVGLLYSSTGTLLAQGTFSNESASGWQQVNFSTPVAISANTTYVIALFTDSGCADDGQYFVSTGVDSAPLHAPQSTGSQGNGVYVYGSAPAFPSLSYSASNYWVDLAFSPASTVPVTGPVTPVSISASSTSLWSASAIPSLPWVPTAGSLTVGVNFYSDVNGTVNGVRFYKGVGSGMSGHHVGLLYSSTGTLLAQATFSNESASGWQEVDFSSPVSISANTTYIVALFTDSGCADDALYFASQGVDNGPLHARQSTASQGNGVYVYGNEPAFPSMTLYGPNYWVDLAFSSM